MFSIAVTGGAIGARYLALGSQCQAARIPAGETMSHFDFTGCRILVVGDLVLDKYLPGSIDRLFPQRQSYSTGSRRSG